MIHLGKINTGDNEDVGVAKIVSLIHNVFK